MNTKLYKCNST